MRFISSIPLLAAAAIMATGSLAAQDGGGTVVLGEVVDQASGQPLGSVHFEFREAVEEGDDVGRRVWEGLTDEYGRFRTDRIPPGTYEVSAQAMAFHSFTYPLDLVGSGSIEFRVELVPAVLELDPIVAVARRSSRLERGGFYERRAAGWGYTMTRAEIEERGPSRVSDLFYQVPGARVVRAGGGAGQFESEVRLRGNCVPTVVLDGSPIALPMRLDELLVVNDLEAIEVYHGSSSPVAVSLNTCGTVMAWTRQAENMDGQPWEWRRFFAAVGFLGLAVLATQ